jgi:hypothetical protein
VNRAVTTVDVSYHQFWLLDAGQRPHPGVLAYNGLIGVAGPGVAIVYTGISSGLVAVSVEARTTAPATIDIAGWDEVVEVSMTAPLGRIRVAALMADPPDRLADLTAAGPGPYRVRVHTNGRDIAMDGVAREPVEHHHLVAWPAVEAPEQVYRQTDSYGADLRQSMANAPTSMPDRPANPH